MKQKVTISLRQKAWQFWLPKHVQVFIDSSLEEPATLVDSLEEDEGDAVDAEDDSHYDPEPQTDEQVVIAEPDYIGKLRREQEKADEVHSQLP